MSRTTEKLQQAIETVKEREAVYGEDGHVRLGRVLKEMFGELHLTEAEDFARYHLFSMVVAKLCRYTRNFEHGGHRDSIHDAGNYCFILEVEDEKYFDHGS